MYTWCCLSFYIYDVSFIPALDAPGASKRSWVPTPDAPSAYFLVAFQIIYQVQFQNENATWNNPWNLLITINLNVKYFHNSIDFTERLLQVYIVQIFSFKLVENGFVNVLSFEIFWSLVTCVEQLHP